MSKTPEYLDIQDGQIVITLEKGFEIDGVKTKSITMREPKVKDQRAVEKYKGDESDRELFMFGNLCGIAPTDFDEMTLDDYVRVQTAYQNFIKSARNI